MEQYVAAFLNFSSSLAARPLRMPEVATKFVEAHLEEDSFPFVPFSRREEEKSSIFFALGREKMRQPILSKHETSNPFSDVWKSFLRFIVPILTAGIEVYQLVLLK